MISRFLLALGLAVLMVVTGFSSYVYLGARQSKVAVPAQKPTAGAPRPKAFALPGTLYLSQSGAIYSLSAGRFHQLTPEDGWSQPSIYPDGTHLLAVRRTNLYSDVYVLSRFGEVVSQLTDNTAPARDPDTGSRDWSFYPRLSPDGSTVFMSYDEPKCGGLQHQIFMCFDVPLSIWTMPVSGPQSRARLWSLSNDYTGGDVQPIPLNNSAVLYTKYDYGPDLKLISQIWITGGRETFYSPGRALTTPSEDCREPSFSPDGHQVAMICTYEKQISQLVVASFDGSTFGNRVTVIADQLVAQPTWAPDGSGIAYLAPSAPDAPFQLWWLPKNAYSPPPPSPIPTPTPTPGGPYNGPLPTPTPSPAPPAVVIKPIQMTTNLGFDATSPLAWVGGA